MRVFNPDVLPVGTIHLDGIEIIGRDEELRSSSCAVMMYGDREENLRHNFFFFTQYQPTFKPREKDDVG